MRKSRCTTLTAELHRARRKRDNFLNAIAEGRAPESVLQRIREIEAEIAALEQRLADCHIKAPTASEHERVARAPRERQAQFDDLMHSDIPLARQVLRKFLEGPL
ncbi:MAG TPA: hypothetical protein VK864_11520, partial [Longimicrobiales bacterium]|nr:hypothetical protein [Longimicrobiales bacterium]